MTLKKIRVMKRLKTVESSIGEIATSLRALTACSRCGAVIVSDKATRFEMPDGKVAVACIWCKKSVSTKAKRKL